MSELWYRLNILGESSFFKKKGLMDGIILPANLIAYYENSIPKTLKNFDLPFLVDPMTYVWGIKDKYIRKRDGNKKKSYEKLVEKLDCNVANLLYDSLIQYTPLSKSNYIEFINNILDLQISFQKMDDSPRKKSLDRIMKFKKDYVQNNYDLSPIAIVPPYFYFNRINDKLYKLTKFSCNYAFNNEDYKDYRIYPIICTDIKLLHDTVNVDKIVQDFEPFEGIIIWINDFDEQEASGRDLNALANFVEKLSGNKDDVINLYGSYFSILLSHKGLTKFSSGICYSDHKAIKTLAGGGGMPIRYYEPHLKTMLLADDMLRLYNSDVPEWFECECPICKQYSNVYSELESNDTDLLIDFFGSINNEDKEDVPGYIDWKRSRLHFLYMRQLEKKQIINNTKEEISKEISSISSILREKNVDPRVYRVDEFDYLDRWLEAIE